MNSEYKQSIHSRCTSNSIISSSDSFNDSESIGMTSTTTESNSSSILKQSAISLGEDYQFTSQYSWDVDVGVNGVCPIFGIPIIQNMVHNGLQKHCKFKYNRLKQFQKVDAGA